MTDIVEVFNGSWTTVNLSDTALINGWVQEPNVRGTWDILWGNIFTIFICTWTMLNLNVPEPGEPQPKIWIRKIFWMVHAVSGPEFILAYAAGQFRSAQKSVDKFEPVFGPGRWQVQHGFFADMGGIHLLPRKEELSDLSFLLSVDRPQRDLYDPKGFPVNSEQLCWLVKNDLVNFDPRDLEVDTILDKSKQDPVAKLIAVLQVGWTILNAVGRWAQGLGITTLELSTLANVVTAILTTLLWINKPADVRKPHVIFANASVQRIREVGHAHGAWKDTPLDFVDNLRPSWALTLRDRLRTSKLATLVSWWESAGGPPNCHADEPLRRFTNDRIPGELGYYRLVLATAMLIYPGILVAGWRFYFPTLVEVLLWRISSLFLLGCVIGIWLIISINYAWQLAKSPPEAEAQPVAAPKPSPRAGTQAPIIPMSTLKVEAQPNVVSAPSPTTAAQADTEKGENAVANTLMESKKQLTKRWPRFGENRSSVEFVAIVILAAAYTIARWYQVVEVFIELRSLPSSTFKQVDWSRYFPHF